VIEMRGRLFLTLASLAALTSAAAADTLPIKGSYGNKDGCAYAKSGESTGSENFFLLTSEAITTAASACTIEKVLKTDGKSFTAKVSCEAEGEDTAKITYGPKGYTIGFTSDATIKWGPLPLCK
jgi:hypothetical protein